jgi:SAM-dependent methyltransferase
MTNNYFGRGVAETYDSDEPVAFDPGVVEPAVDFLAVLAAGGRTLELGIGTGRIALPLSQRGVPIHGIELSPEMVEQLQAKQGSESIEVTIGDFSTTEVEGTFTLAYLVFNTITNLTSQRAQIRCFQNVANHLERGGCFVIETFIWASSGLTDIQHQGHGPGKDVHNGDHGEAEAASAALVPSGVQG